MRRQKPKKMVISNTGWFTNGIEYPSKLITKNSKIGQNDSLINWITDRGRELKNVLNNSFSFMEIRVLIKINRARKIKI